MLACKRRGPTLKRQLACLTDVFLSLRSHLQESYCMFYHRTTTFVRIVFVFYSLCSTFLLQLTKFAVKYVCSCEG